MASNVDLIVERVAAIEQSLDGRVYAVARAARAAAEEGRVGLTACQRER